MMPTQSQKPKNILILQTDWEGGIVKVAQDLIDNGSNVTKVIFESCDKIYAKNKIPTIAFDAPINSPEGNFKNWLREQISEKEIDCIFVYNEYRPYNKIGYKLAAELGIECIVLELGLLRPNFITIYSRGRDHFNYLSQEWAKVIDENLTLELPPELECTGDASLKVKLWLFGRSYVKSRLLSKLGFYKHFNDQRSMKFRYHVPAGIVDMVRRSMRKKQSAYNELFEGEWAKTYYVVPLQVHCDSQITERSNFTSIDEFIEKVVESFAAHAPEDTKLIFKVHPIDRGYSDYGKLIKKLDSQFEEQRIYYLDKVHNPSLLTKAIGTVTINSSMALSSIINGTPIITLGDTAFDLPRLSYDGDLDSFWTKVKAPDPADVSNFVALLRRTSQGQGTFYKAILDIEGKAKIQWPEEFAYLFPKQDT